MMTGAGKIFGQAILIFSLVSATFLVLSGGECFATDLSAEYAKITQELAKAKADFTLTKTRYFEKKREFENPNVFAKYIGEPVFHGIEKDLKQRKVAYDEAQSRYQQLSALQKKLEAWKQGKNMNNLIEDTLKILDDRAKTYSDGSIVMDERDSW